MTTAVTRRDRRGDGRRRAWAWLALLAFALNVLAPLLVNGPVAASAALAGAGLSGDPLSGQVVICTPAGLRVIGADGQPRPLTDPERGDTQFCALCLPLTQDGLAALPSAGTVALPPPPRAVVGRLVPSRAALGAPADGYRLPAVRAPPSV